MLTPKQLDMLIAFDRDGEATDFCDYYSGGTLAWRNRESVINALIRKGLLTKDCEVTERGRQYIPAR